MIDVAANGPYGHIDNEPKIEGLTQSEVHRLIQTKNPAGYRKWTPVLPGVDRVTSLPLTPIISGKDIVIEQHNNGIIEGLFVHSTPIKEDKANYIDLTSIQRKIERKRENLVSKSVSPMPNALKEDDYAAVENVVPIDRKQVQQVHDNVESKVKPVNEIATRGLEALLSFNASAHFMEAFVRDGMGHGNISAETSPLHFLSNISNIEIVSHYLDEAKLPDSLKRYYMRKVADYYFERSTIEDNTARKQKILRGTKVYGSVQEEQEENSEGNSTGAYVTRT